MRDQYVRILGNASEQPLPVGRVPHAECSAEQRRRRSSPDAQAHIVGTSIYQHDRVAKELAIRIKDQRHVVISGYYDLQTVGQLAEPRVEIDNGLYTFALMTDVARVDKQVTVGHLDLFMESV